ncbi:MAG: electron transfer flavoprotein subunit alpha/FixB family protein [Bacteroidetes bacterium]|nr:electron transfer flavoprotein subunit alpha/FixB family protein [Bacteroidota bacterium]
MNVLIFAEQIDGIFKKSTFEAISYGNDIAKNNGGQAIAAVLGKVDNAHLAELATYGADKIIHVNNDKLNAFVPEAYAKVVAEIASKENASVLVISNTYTGKSIAGRVAAKLRRGVFSGKAFADVNITSAVKVLAITPNTFDIKQDAKSANIGEMSADLSDADFITNIIEVSRVTGKIPLTEAEVVVSGGRGLKGPENWHLIEDLANALGAATACSKPVSDMHWRPHSEHVGQTGITIKPNLYIAVGISGAIQHLAGVSSSKVIVAINKDPEAPFFKAADYGIVGDAFEVMPKIIEAAKALKN